jgi:hypothetical protein
MRGGHIDLAELLKEVIIRPHDLHEAAPLVRDGPELLDDDTFDT